MLKPILFHLFHEPIYSYPLFMGLGWGIGYNVTLSMWIKRGLSEKILRYFFLISFILAWVGAKVFFLAFSMPDEALNYSKEVNFWLGGGFVFYGGLVFAGLFSMAFFYFNRRLKLEDLGLLTPGLALGHAIGRVGCLLAGCCFGEQCDLPIAVSYRGVNRHPVQIYEALGLVILFFLLKRFWIKNESPKTLGIIYLLFYGVLRFILEFFRGDLIRGLYYGLSTSQWVSILIFSFGLFIFVKDKKKEM